MNSSFCLSTCSCSNFRLPEAELRLIACVCGWDRTNAYSSTHRRCLVIQNQTPCLDPDWMFNKWTKWWTLDDTWQNPNGHQLQSQMMTEVCAKPLHNCMSNQPKVEKDWNQRRAPECFPMTIPMASQSDPTKGSHTIVSARAETNEASNIHKWKNP